jgi:hypothetical protein
MITLQETKMKNLTRWISYWIQLQLARLRLWFAWQHYNREFDRWRKNYECGQSVYDTITGGRLTRAEQRLERCLSHIKLVQSFRP